MGVAVGCCLHFTIGKCGAVFTTAISLEVSVCGDVELRAVITVIVSLLSARRLLLHVEVRITGKGWDTEGSGAVLSYRRRR